MIYTAKDIDITAVTADQIGRCWKAFDQQTGRAFYRVESESDPTATYSVRWTREHGFTCSCPAGQSGFRNCKTVCKHVRWSLAAAKEEKQALAELSASASQIEKAAPAAWTAKEQAESRDLYRARLAGSQTIMELRQMAAEIFDRR